ncbi:MaoC family dehydratase [Hydrogenophaga sp. OTU3427]|uniref:MaoC family dehydratase n=1 Tax=Hydrogenophaga sp. OTU3427 TaxID=3043856 RepID=UPI00313AC214
MKHFHTLDDLAAEVGREVALSDWVAVTQAQIQLFADATGDHQWIHIDEARARSSPFGSTIAHGFLTLSLVPRFFDTTMVVEDLRMGVNYGLNKVRFTAPVPAGSRVRGRLVLKAVEPIAGNGLQATWDVTVEREDGGKPACVAEMLVRYYR